MVIFKSVVFFVENYIKLTEILCMFLLFYFIKNVALYISKVEIFIKIYTFEINAFSLLCFYVNFFSQVSLHVKVLYSILKSIIIKLISKSIRLVL